MQPISRYLDHPVVRYLIIAVFSTLASVIFFALGGSLAAVSNNEDTFLGFSFKASGAIGGFVLIFFASLKALERLTPPPVELSLQVHVYLLGIPEGFSREETYVCEGRIFDRESGEKREFTSEPRWEQGYLTIDFHEVGHDDFLGARIHEGDKVWMLDDFLPLVSERRAELLKVAHQQPDTQHPVNQNGTTDGP